MSTALTRFAIRRQYERPPLMEARRVDPTFCRDAVYTGRDADRMHAALEAVLKIHRPVGGMCVHCQWNAPAGITDHMERVPWPCPTARAIETKLNEEEQG